MGVSAGWRTVPAAEMCKSLAERTPRRIIPVALSVLSLLCFPGAAQEWSVELTIDHLFSQQLRTFGVDSLGTDGYDVGLDVPIPPPGVIFYSYFQGTVTFPYLGTDIRDATEDSVKWNLCFAEVTDTVSVSWEPSSLPAEGTLSIDGIDMRDTTEVRFTESGCVEIAYAAGDTTAPPAQVQNLRVTDEGSLDLLLAWSEVDENIYGAPISVAHYTLYRSEQAHFEATFPDSIAAPIDTTYIDVGVWSLPDGAHYYRARAVDSGNRQGEPSLPAAAFRFQLP